MAKRAKKAKRARKSPAAPRGRTRSTQGSPTEAFMALLAERRFEEIGLAEVAMRADMSLSQLRAAHGSTLAILAAHIKEIDRIVLDGGDAEGETARERLFEVLMRRIEALAPYKAAVRSLMSSARRSPGLALALNSFGVRSQRWMLSAAGIDAAGPRGGLRAQGAAMMFARVLWVWTEDDEPGLDRTMAALDRGLASAERWSGFVDDLCAFPACLARGARRRRPAREGAAEAEAA